MRNQVRPRGTMGSGIPVLLVCLDGTADIYRCLCRLAEYTVRARTIYSPPKAGMKGKEGSDAG